MKYLVIFVSAVMLGLLSAGHLEVWQNKKIHQVVVTDGQNPGEVTREAQH